MASIDRTRTVATTPHRAWDVLADFGTISSWANNVDHSCILNQSNDGALVGTIRRVQVGANALTERITEFAPPRALGYQINGLPRRLRRVTNRWALRPGRDDTTVVTLTSTVEIGSRPWQKIAEHVACRILARQSDVLLAGLANRLEKTDV